MRFCRIFPFILFVLFTCTVSAANDTPQVNISPNAALDRIIINIQSVNDDSLSIVILDLLGRTVHKSNEILHSGNNFITRNLSNYGINPGTYLIHLDFASQHYSINKKLIFTGSNKFPLQPIDILHESLSINLRNLTSKHIDGSALIQFISKQDSLKLVVFDLLKLPVSKVLCPGNATTFTQNDSQLLIHFETAIKHSDTVQLQIDYSGQPMSDSTWGGFYFNGNYAYNLGVGFTSNPHSFGRCWFPCMDNFTEKSTYSFRIRVDSGWKAVCNGLLLYDSLNADQSHTFGWEIKQPISAYLASVAVGKYEWVKLTYKGLNRTYPIWIAAEAKDTANARNSMMNLIQVLNCFESRFGAYPFDRIGYVGVPFNSGAMEHATTIAYPIYALNGTTSYETLYGHELSHMWWGDLVTCKSPEDMWLNEGWASFCEALVLECLYGKEAYQKDIRSKLETVLLNAPKNDNGYLPVSGISHDATYGTHVYKKGALVAHSLRTLMGDSSFFAACKSYLNKFSYGNATSEDMQLEFQKFTQLNLNAFFDHWVYAKGYEDIMVNHYKVIDRKVYITLVNLTKYRIPSTESIPLKLDLVSTSGKVQHYSYNSPIGVTDLVIDLQSDLSDVAYINVNPTTDMAWGCLGNLYSINTKGVINFNNQLSSINVISISDTAKLWVEHHWTPPNQGNLSSQGIRISPDRYWRFDGVFPKGFVAYAFLAYDGSPTSYLDLGLFEHNNTEDSLVLLFRPKGEASWQLHIHHTFQPGASKTDKTGRFWIDTLQSGDYAIGTRDYLVNTTHQVEIPNDIEIKLIPNPARESTTILFNQSLSARLSVTDVSGRLLDNVEIEHASEYLLHTANYQNGIYYICIQGSFGKIFKTLAIKGH